MPSRHNRQNGLRMVLSERNHTKSHTIIVWLVFSRKEIHISTYNCKTLCFTGRRPKNLCGYNNNKYNDLVDKVTEICETFHQNGYRNFISGGAQGFDQLAFWAVLRLKKIHPDVKNIVYVRSTASESF